MLRLDILVENFNDSEIIIDFKDGHKRIKFIEKECKHFYKTKVVSVNLEIKAESKIEVGKVAGDFFLEKLALEGFRLDCTIVH